MAVIVGIRSLIKRENAMTVGLRTLIMLFAFCFSQSTQTALADMQDENFQAGLPQGYKIGFNARNEKMSITEMVPAAETVENWTEMVTVQIFFGPPVIAPESFESEMVKGWRAACPGSEYKRIRQGSENGYPFLLWLLSCESNPATGKPEIVWFKAVRGADSLYLLQKAFKFEPSKAQIEQTMKHFREAQVCDTRLPDRPCLQ
jgi:hypothetical protein